MQESSEIPRQLLVPEWARRIEVIQTDTDLVVSGWGASFQIEEREFSSGRKDLLDGFDKGRKLPRDKSRNALHFLFAAADTLAKRVEFVRAYGPVLASGIDNPEQTDFWEHMELGEEPTTPDAVAYQKLVVLDIEQRLFSLVFNLVIAVNKLRDWGKRAVEAERKYTAHFRGGPQVWISETSSFLTNRELASDEERLEIKEMGRLLPEIQSLIDSYPQGVFWEFDDPFQWDNPVSMFCTRTCIATEYSLNIYRWANHLLCHIFNLFPPSLQHVNGIVHELPQVKPSGIRSTLYHMLRLEYRYPRELRPCGNPVCGGYFALDRGNKKYCSDSCKASNNQRNHRKRARLTQRRRPPRKP
jgi:hypothetical protein